LQQLLGYEQYIEQRISDVERLQAREKLTQSEKQLSGILFERGVDSQGFARIRSKGDQALFGGKSTQQMKSILGVPDNRALADFLPTITIKAKILLMKLQHSIRSEII
jgi:DNA-damage-inducible protein D